MLLAHRLIADLPFGVAIVPRPAARTAGQKQNSTQQRHRHHVRHRLGQPSGPIMLPPPCSRVQSVVRENGGKVAMCETVLVAPDLADITFVLKSMVLFLPRRQGCQRAAGRAA